MFYVTQIKVIYFFKNLLLILLQYYDIIKLVIQINISNIYRVYAFANVSMF